MKTLNAISAISVSLLLAACGSSSSDSNGSSNVLGLDGTWGGILEDIDYNLSTTSVTIKDQSATEFRIDGNTTGQTASINALQPDIFEYYSNDDIFGGFVTDPSKTYAVAVNELWDFAVIQKGASAPYGSASVVDLNGAWKGTAVGFFNEIVYRYPVEGECGSGICVWTATGPARTLDGATFVDVTGTQSTWNLSHRSTLVFGTTWSNSIGSSGFGGAALSKDKKFLGGYGCPQSSGFVEECEYAALTRQ